MKKRCIPIEVLIKCNGRMVYYKDKVLVFVNLPKNKQEAKIKFL